MLAIIINVHKEIFYLFNLTSPDDSLKLIIWSFGTLCLFNKLSSY